MQIKPEPSVCEDCCGTLFTFDDQTGEDVPCTCVLFDPVWERAFLRWHPSWAVVTVVREPGPGHSWWVDGERDGQADNATLQPVAQ